MTETLPHEQADQTTVTNNDARQPGVLEFFATCPKGFERLLAGELASLGTKRVRALRGQVAFGGTLADAYRACLWSRLASRVTLVLAHVDATDSDTLYESVRSLAWEDQIPLDATFAVDAHGTNDELRNTQFVALRAKDAICDRMQAKLGGRPNVAVRRPEVTVVVRLRGERATVGIDLSGAPLFRREQMRLGAGGPGELRPDYAAALLATGGWHRCVRHGSPAMVSMFSGMGTVLVEAAAQALDQAPGLLRAHWGFERWYGHDADVWSALRKEAERRAEAGSELARGLTLIALDTRTGAETTARQALRSSGLDVEVKAPGSTAELERALAHVKGTSTLMTVDLSWLSECEEAREVFALGLAGDAAAGLPAGSAVCALTASPGIDQALGLAPTETTDVLLGRDEASMRRYVIGEAPAAGTEGDGAMGTSPTPGAGRGADNAPAAPERASVTLKDGTKVPVLVAASDQFAARLWKVARLRAKWARREDISCYRVYDADLPDYAVAIDLYQASAASRGADAHRRWLVVQEYAAPKGIDEGLAHRRLLDVLAIAPVVLDVNPADVTLRVRRRARGGSQYADGGRSEGANGRSTSPVPYGRDASGRGLGASRGSWLDLAPGTHLIDEGGLVFEVNLSERLDTGIFLDHRDVRAEVREMAKQTYGSKRFLNLFAYTGTASCYAADGGAKFTTTVDLSYTYLDWARRNMARNGFTGEDHEYVQADVIDWVSEQRRTPNRWDLVFCDPPTFSNSSKMGRRTWDAQRDHAELIIGMSRLLTLDGEAIFSCNLRTFRPDTEKLARAGVVLTDITARTIPEDFARNPRIHHCYLVKRYTVDEALRLTGLA